MNQLEIVAFIISPLMLLALGLAIAFGIKWLDRHGL